MAAQKNVAMRILIILIWSVLRVNSQSEQCFADIEKPNVFFGSKTSYFASRASKISTETDCTPFYTWALIRHGTRYPGRESIVKMSELDALRKDILSNHKEGRGKLCQKDLENLEKWQFNLSEELDDELTSQGLSDQKTLAQKIKEAFPKLFDTPSKDSFLFQSSAAKRAKDSAVAFTNELLGTNFASTDGNGITENEAILHVNKHCPSFVRNVQDNSSTYEQAELFKKSEAMKNSIFDISNRLGYKQRLPYDSIELMYDACAYESAWYVNSKPAFCAAFLPEDFKIFEYLNDMEDYYERGYGSSYASKIGCMTVRDMMLSLENAAKNPQSTLKGTFHFSHSEMIVPTTVKLGLNQDSDPLRHDNYDKMKTDRKWRLAHFDSFAANIIAVLYKCPSDNGTRDIVSFYQNEHRIELPKCATSPCTLEKLKENFDDALDEDRCNLKFCGEPESLKKSSASSLFLSSGVLFAVLFYCIGLFY